MHNEAVHRCIIAVDIEGFSHPQRNDYQRHWLRAQLHAQLREAFKLIGLERDRITEVDRGDGALCFIDAQKSRVLHAVAALANSVDHYNRDLANELTRLRLRVVVHAGEVVPDDHSASGTAANFACRLLDSQALRERLAASRRDLVLMVSERIYDEVIEQGLCDSYRASEFERVAVSNKETVARAWVLRPLVGPAGSAVAGSTAAVGGGLAPRAGAGRGPEGGGSGPDATAAAGTTVPSTSSVPAVRAPIPSRFAAIAPWLPAIWGALATAARLWLRWFRLVPAWAVALTTVIILVLGFVVGRQVAGRQDGRAAVTTPCAVPVELTVLTSTAMEGIIRELAAKFLDTEEAVCRRGSIDVFSLTSSSELVNAVAAGWTRDHVRNGPTPSVLVAAASAEVDRINERLSSDRLKPLGSIAATPVVMAVRRAVRQRLNLDRQAPWDTILDWARPPENPRVRIVRADPTSSTAALLATIGLYGAAGGDLHAVEQALESTGGDEVVELCADGQAAGMGGPPPAVLTTEQVVVAHTRGLLGGPCGVTPPGELDRLEAICPSEGLPVLDHPYVLLPAALASPARESLGRDFFRYLESVEAQGVLREAGFRDRDLRVGATVGSGDGICAGPLGPTAPSPDGAAAAGLAAWDRARRFAKGLLAIDVSGSMKEKFTGEGGTRITAARAAAAEAVELIGPRDHIGLVRFSTRLAGDRDFQELVPLGPSGGMVRGKLRRDQALTELGRLKVTDGDTGLYDTMLAGVDRLRTAPGDENEAVNALIVVTDGVNDDPSGGASARDVLRRLDVGDRVLVFMLTFGPVRCDTGELRRLDDHQDIRCIDAGEAGLDGAFEQVTAALWGTSGAGVER